MSGPSSIPPGSGRLAAKYGSVAISIATAAIGVYVRFQAVEQRQEALNQAIVELRQELQRVADRVSVVERDREMLERVHAIELQLSGVRDKVEEIDRSAVRRKQR